MIKNYFKIAIRNIRRNSTYTILNMSGMAVGMACSVLILLWVQDEWSFDRHFKNADNLYRVLESFISIDGHLYQESTTPSPLAAALKDQYPEIIRASRYNEFPIPMQNGDDYIFERVAVADDDFLKMFDIKFIKGDINTALDAPNNIILTEEMARKYFGNDDPIGKTLKSSGYTFNITGIIMSFPHNSHLHFDFLASFKFFGEEKFYWDSHGFGYTYIELKNGTDYKLVEEKIRGIIKSHVKSPGYNPDIFLQKVKDIHLNSSGKYSFDIGGHGDIAYVRILGIVAIFILVIACVNFMNLATAQSSTRSKEIGVRKVVGSNKTKIIFQFLGESLIIVFVAHILGMILVEIMLPGFNNLTAKQLYVNYRDPYLYFWLLTIVIICSIIAGSYPALYLSSLKPLNIIKREISKNPGKTVFRRVMVIFQYSLSVLLIICALVVGKQLLYLQNKNLGLNLEQIGHFKFGNGVRSEVVKADLAKNPNILNSTIGVPDVFDKDGGAAGFDWEGNKNGGEYFFSALYTDADFAKTFQLEMKDGRYFSNDSPNDTTTLVINEKASEVLGFKEPVGHVLRAGGLTFTIIGVVKDFHFQSLKNKISPLVIMKIPPKTFFRTNCYLRMRSENISSTIDYVKKLFKSYNLSYPLEFNFLDDEYDALYRTEQRIDKILIYSSLLAIIISCIGLIGLSLFMTDLRTKEIGIRKVNGSKSMEIFLLLSKEYFLLVLISVLIASPLAWYVMNKWLHSYAYHINIDPWLFVVVGFLVLLIAIFTVGFQSFKAATRNPVEALRYE